MFTVSDESFMKKICGSLLLIKKKSSVNNYTLLTGFGLITDKQITDH